MPENDLGPKIIETIRRILRWSDAVGIRIQYSGEGAERRFRYWVMRELFEDVLGWPSENTLQGERFDITLLDDDQHPFISIETKTPYHEASASERRIFEERLSAFPSLRYAVFTNGERWQLYRIIPGEVLIEDAGTFILGEHSEIAAKNFFSNLLYRGQRHKVGEALFRISRGEAFLSASLVRLTADLEGALAEFQVFFQSLFHGLRDGSAGTEAQSVTLSIYERWASDSIRVRPSHVAEGLAKLARDFTPQKIADTIAGFGFKGDVVQQVAEDILTLPLRDRAVVDRITPRIWPLFESEVRKLCAQTAHVQIARMLLYRIGEDEGVFSRLLSGKELSEIVQSKKTSHLGREYRATERVEQVRRQMQDFLPSVYVLSEFDWWLVKPEMRPSLSPRERDWLRPFDEQLEEIFRGALSRLSRYVFETVDLDIWRNLYENYLPSEERQRLGGFYTPDALVNLVLDLADYRPDVEGLCKHSFIDPACGSGAFVTTALGRLQQHLDLPLECHGELHSRKMSTAQKSELRLRIIEHAVNAVDIHPFASFLTTLNVLFTILPAYVRAREANPEFQLSLHVYAWDALDATGSSNTDQLSLYQRMNSRVQRSLHDHDEYQNLMLRGFDRVFGNPPWGGVLKGELAPIYDEAKKKLFKATYAAAAQGKYDIYGLFMQRALRLLLDGGRFALVTQSTYLDKEWAAGLRAHLAADSTLNYIVEMNPFGQLFFNAMNAPCVTVADKGSPDAKHQVNAIRSQRSAPHGDGKLAKQAYVAGVLRETAHDLQTSSSANHEFASGLQIPQLRLAETAAKLWNLATAARKIETKAGWNAAQLLEIRQGVTPGNCLELFLASQAHFEQAGVEKELLHKAIKSRKLEQWSVPSSNLLLFYPYHEPATDRWVPAFSLDVSSIKDKDLKTLVRGAGLRDALDFDTPLDEYERKIVRQSGMTQEAVERLLQHRNALGLVEYPNAAKYLVQNYKKLESRIFKKKNIRDFNRRWYEYLWPRDPKVLFLKQRILSPTLMRESRFVFDDRKFISDHACLFLQPTRKTLTGWGHLRELMSKRLGRRANDRDLLLYCLAYLNSPDGSRALTEGRQPTPKGSYQISEKSLSDVFIPEPGAKSKAILALTESLVKERGPLDETKRKRHEAKLFSLLDQH